ncbi:MAG: HDOD domain-containing protein [Armatimonadetes bacterium]|nr:HDOD domain-containing protein [Armatimonadota bacterium]
MDLESISLLISRSENLPTLPKVVNTIVELAEDPNSSTKDFERVMSTDAAITAKVLKVASSPYYGMRQINSVSQAVGVLGMKTVKSLVIGAGFHALMEGKETSRLFSKEKLWSHSLATGLASRVIAKLKKPGHAEEMYCAGMLHDIGLLVLDRFAPAQLDLAIKMAEEEGFSLWQAETLLFDFTHCAVGALLAEKWKLADVLTAVIRHHHDQRPSTEYSFEVAIVSLANTMAHRAGFTNCTPHQTPEYDEAVCETVGLPMEQLEVIEDVVKQEVFKAGETFGLK